MSNAIFDKIRTQPCLVCGSRNVDVCHVKSRGSGGGDEWFNVMPLCRIHHIEQHSSGIITFSQRYIAVSSYLYDNGWFLENGRLKNIYYQNYNHGVNPYVTE